VTTLAGKSALYVRQETLEQDRGIALLRTTRARVTGDLVLALEARPMLGATPLLPMDAMCITIRATRTQRAFAIYWE
jgi:hypothetical protein